MEKLVRSRFVRLMLAAALIGLGAWAFLPYVTSRVASSAFVNAELVRVTAPIAGRLSRDLPTKGTLLDGVAKTPLIEALTPDRRHLVALEQQRAAVKAQVELATGQLAELAAADRDLAARTERHRTAVVEQIGHEIDEAKANLNACQADQRQQQQIRDRTEVLAGSGVVTRQRVDDVQAAYDGVVARCQAANAQIERFKVEAAAAAQGIFLQDGFNDTPYSEQERDRLLLRRQELEAAVQNGNSQLKELEAEIAEEQQRFDQMSHYAAILPAGHVVWNVSASPGSAVVEGQTLLDLADCRKRFVDVEVPERDFESINI
ncbi:MAG TPA: hypothetical protein VMU42_00350, partial [Candidatus Sulfotelmatobacter sp.]|nr:hypothetical protein [Candidatus Sulfotelmatobacter sp.]